MVAKFRGSADGYVADSVCKTCLLRPGVIEVSELPTEKVFESVKDPKFQDVHQWFVGCCALISYRQGNFQAAIDWAKKHPDFKGMPGAFALVVQAMAEHQLGLIEEARNTLDAADAIIPATLRRPQAPSDPGPILTPAADVAHDWLAAEILRREAEALMSGKVR